MSQSQPFSDHKIRQTIEALRANGQNVTSWAVQSRLGGGDFLRIQQIIDQLFPNIGKIADQRPASNMQFSPQQKMATEDIIDKQMPSEIEASMYQMQTSLGQMANKIWSDAASNAENQVRDKLFSAQQAHDDAVQAHAEVAEQNQQMQATISQLSAELNVLEVDYKTSVDSLAQERKSLAELTQQRDSLEKNVKSLETDNQTLEQSAFNSNIQAAKAEGLAEIIKEQLSLAKQSEKQIQKALDRSEKKVNQLNREVHNSSQSLRDEMRDRQIPLHPQKRAAPAPAITEPRNYPAQELPQPSAASIPTPDFITSPAENPLPQSVSASQATADQMRSNQTKAIKDLGHSLVMSRAKSLSQVKTRSLSEKLFDRKKRQSNKNK
ncbi:MAG: hypothetical protein OFPII_17260 [Osedax symbiont Rs1]|nr:MAG: hypothetical protein OFPII_17260 [Osedax symbiont Rs1]